MAIDPEAALIGEQLKHALTLVRAELAAIRAEQEHQRKFVEHRLEALEAQGRDFELRIRAATDGVTQFKMWSGLSTGGSWLVSVVALIKAWWGGV